MGIEIEHKYCVKDPSYKEMADKIVEIKQGYLNKDPERTVRVRIANDKGYITIKGKTRKDWRVEYEYEIPFDDAQAMLALCLPNIIEKTRYIVPYEGLKWEIDEFHGSRAGMVVAEVELPDSGYKYSLPPFVGGEVTGDARYYNSNL